jgi:hypothetical protein
MNLPFSKNKIAVENTSPNGVGTGGGGEKSLAFLQN